MALLPSDFPPLTGSSLLGAAPILPPISYASNLAAPSSSRDDWPLTFVKPAKKLSFVPNELNEGKEIWNLSLVGYSLGPRPYYERLLASMEKLWKLKGSLSLLSLADDFFLLKFTAVEDYDLVWSGGPWFLLGRPFILQRWNPKFQPRRDESASIPLWIKVLNLPLALWTPAGISKIASFVGEPLYVDTLTAKRTRLTFARICVKVDKDSELPEIIPLEIDGVDLNLTVVYDWKPSKCEGCGSLVHNFALCPKNPNPKPTLPPKAVFRGRSKSRNPTKSQRPPSRSKPNTPSSTPAAQLILHSSKAIAQSDLPPTADIAVTSTPSALDPHLLDCSITLPSDPILTNPPLPNLNLPQAASPSSSFHSNHANLLPPMVILANSFGSLPVEEPNAEDARVENPDGNLICEEDSSSSHNVEGNVTKKQINFKGSPSTSSTSTKVSIQSKSPSKKGKSKPKTAKKAKPYK
ncbi:hypothetical protein KFK09_000938 [Dendrobium nobile]|uniref:DUF4283 domain-containing protein n=1 Tax=Dendrobium nobile TaxID=94219 RepID=A0A8T3C9W1_DENNO|nr:hypothetical protein KFK09_000938 [Dendrobium nobile]